MIYTILLLLKYETTLDSSELNLRKCEKHTGGGGIFTVEVAYFLSTAYTVSNRRFGDYVLFNTSQ